MSHKSNRRRRLDLWDTPIFTWSGLLFVEVITQRRPASWDWIAKRSTEDWRRRIALSTAPEADFYSVRLISVGA